MDTCKSTALWGIPLRWTRGTRRRRRAAQTDAVLLAEGILLERRRGTSR